MLETLDLKLNKNTTMLKQVTYVAYMLKIILLTGTPHIHEFGENLKSVPETFDFFR